MNKQVIIVGAGAAGLMAAGQCALSGVDVLILEKMNLPARKLRITGKGRCNLTNTLPLSEFIEQFGPNGQFLRQAFSRFFSSELISFFEELGIHTVTERGGRIFPQSSEATEIVDALLVWLRGLGVKIKTNCQVTTLRIENGKIIGVEAAAKTASKNQSVRTQHLTNLTYQADAVILTTGGASYPGTGSSGDGFVLAKAVGHTIIPIRPALVPLITTGDVASRLQGLSLRNVNCSIWINNKKHCQAFGEMLFTSFGVSGPVILSLSKIVVDALRAKKKVCLAIDLKPALENNRLDARLLRDCENYGKRQFSNVLKNLLPRTLIPICSEQTLILPGKPAHQISVKERKRLRVWLKDFRLDITGHRPISEALVTAGGIHLKEVDPRTMESRLVNGLYFAGEVLDIDGDTGGYNLQAAFSTGWLASRSAAQTTDF